MPLSAQSRDSHGSSGDRICGKSVKKIVKRILKTGLALGGGAARGQAHVGVLKVFAEEHIIIDLVAGTSAGSLVGALFCTGHG
ncbi:MAG: patatin-like phospholipase family protein, partial [Spirochaetales bacterium]